MGQMLPALIRKLWNLELGYILLPYMVESLQLCLQTWWSLEVLQPKHRDLTGCFGTGADYE